MADNGRVGWSVGRATPPHTHTHTHTQARDKNQHNICACSCNHPDDTAKHGKDRRRSRMRVVETVSTMHKGGVPPGARTGVQPPPGPLGPPPEDPPLPFCPTCRTCLGHRPSEAGLNRRRTGHLCAPCNTRRGRAVQPRISWLVILRDLSGHREQSAPSSTAKVPLLCGPVTRLLQTPSLWGGGLLVKRRYFFSSYNCNNFLC